MHVIAPKNGAEEKTHRETVDGTVYTTIVNKRVL